MVSRNQLKAVLPQPTFKKELIIRSQTTNDIIQEILAADELFAEQYKLIAKFFDSGNSRKTAKRIWDFLKTNIRYVVESDAKQTSCSPAMLMFKGQGDCKHYSLFTAGILRALGLPYYFRFASYNVLNREPGHVYVIMTAGGTETIIDAVIDGFDTEKTWIYKTDKNPKNMLYRLSGVENRNTYTAKPLDMVVGMGGVGKTKAERKAKRAEKKEKRKAKGPLLKRVVKAAGKGIKKAAKAVSKTVVKVAAAPPRNAFLLLLKINALNLAVKVYQAIQKDEAKVSNWWKKLGGSYASLKKNATNGSKKKRAKQVNGHFISGIGEPVTAASVIAVATPILVALATLLKELKMPDAEVTETATEGLNQIQAEVNGDVESTGRYTPQNNQYGRYEPQSNQYDNREIESTQSTDNMPIDDEPESSTGIDTNTVLIGGAVVLGLIAISKN